MSIVGPRPLPVYEYMDERKRYGHRFDERYGVPQGLTCIWQINHRSESDFTDRMQMDADYSRRRGMLLDIKLFFQTVVYSLLGKAAY